MSSPIKGYARWTRQDKIKLLHGIKMYGYRDIRSIAKLIPNKTQGAIRTMIYKYLLLAKNAVKATNPLDEWLKLDIFREHDSMIPEALLYIYLNEDHPPPSETGGIDISTFYEILYCASRNQTLPDLSQTNIEALCNLHEVLDSKISQTTEAEVLEYLNSISESTMRVPQNVYSKKKD